jgi:hypothetical protein
MKKQNTQTTNVRIILTLVPGYAA